MKILFLAHRPNHAHLNYVKALNARIKILPFDKYHNMMKLYNRFGYLFLIISWIYSFFIPIKEDILLVDGGTSLYTAIFLKMRCKRLKIIYFDADFFFYDLNRKDCRIKKMVIKKIDGIISDSEMNKKYASRFLDVPIEVCPPYPKDVERKKVVRKNYGLYVGRLDPEKKIKRIVDFGLQCPYFEKFFVLGDGVLRKHVKNVSEKNNKLVYGGLRNDVERYYNQCRFLIHIPDFDPHPCVTMEAALCGCFPIISGGVGSKYLFDRFFIVNNPNNFDEINKKIRYILEHEQKINKLLAKSIDKIPIKKQSLKNFKNKFEKIMKTIQESNNSHITYEIPEKEKKLIRLKN